MAEYTLSALVGPPRSGRYSVNDVVTDAAGTKWRCVKGGLADGGLFPNQGNAVFAPVSQAASQGAPTAKTTSATLTAAELLAGIVTGNQGAGAAAAYTLPLATAMDTALPNFRDNDSFEFSVVNLSTTAAEDITMTTNTGWTLVGNMVITESAAASGANSVGRFRARKTGAGAWTLYRIA